ncbi:MAG: S8 family serine peptidase [Dermatophilaceae bacterium]
MRIPTLRAGLATSAAVAAVVAGLAPSVASAAPAGSGARPLQPCTSDTREGYSHCMSRFRAPSPGATDRAPDGYLARDFRSAYKLPSKGASGTVAIVIAFDVPNAEKDLAVYRKLNGLPACTTANGCFTKVNQKGEKKNYPPADGGWALEGSMDLDMVSAACPTCKILLVESDDNYNDNLAAATRTAWRLGAPVISHSYGGNEYGGMWSFRDAYEHTGAISVASSGDYGFTAASSPAVFRTVLAVGGTSLTKASNARGWDEDVWAGAGSGCSAYVPKGWVQKDRHCQMRTVADVSAVADPETGVAIYDTYENPFGIPPGWIVGGGTSASAPLVAGMIGLAGNGATYRNTTPYLKRSAFFDVVGGSNGSCGGDYLCTGTKGYDAPTGIGTPNGLTGL